MTVFNSLRISDSASRGTPTERKKVKDDMRRLEIQRKVTFSLFLKFQI